MVYCMLSCLIDLSVHGRLKENVGVKRINNYTLNIAVSRIFGRKILPEFLGDDLFCKGNHFGKRMFRNLYFTPVVVVLFCCEVASSQTPPPRPPAKLVAHSGGVDFRRAETKIWYTATDSQPLFERERLRTLDNGRALVELEDLSRVTLNPRSELTVLPPRNGTAKATLKISKGLFYFLHRNQPREINVETPVASAAIEGTEFVLAVDENTGATTLTLLDGHVRLSNPFGQVDLSSGEQGKVESGQPPRKTAVVETHGIVQWLLYYPGVLAPDELDLDSATRSDLRDSLAAYRAGDLLQALARYPAGRIPATPAEKIYLAALNLSCGQQSEFAVLNSELPENNTNVRALRLLVEAVQPDSGVHPVTGHTASEHLALSYLLQSRRDLPGSLESAREAVRISPNFGFGWERVAELEFSFGRVKAARNALDRALEHSPRNAQAHSLQGFLELARGRARKADVSFSAALAIDPMLGNAWLGRGLGHIRAGEISKGRGDLETAAALEPNRALLRSYLGKAFAHEAQYARGIANRAELRALAIKELNLAVQADPLDPTPWLYLALLRHDAYQTAAAIKNLEKSQQLNDNRAVYRSQFLLDQDQAVRSANLANIFADADMNNVSIRESARAVSFDYANYSAHLNLARSLNELRDPTRFNLRYESEWFNEHLLATLLAPGGSVSLSQNLSQQEYSQLFAVNGFGLSSSSEYLSTGEFRQTLSQFGTFGGTSYAVDFEYQHNDGVRVNNGLDRTEVYARIKHQITPQDSLLLLAKYQNYDSGDNFQYYDAGSARPAFEYSETQEPMLLAGWHHEWSPGVHTLFLGGRLVNDQQLSDTNAAQTIAVVNPVNVMDPRPLPFDVNYQSRFEIYTAELNQIIQYRNHTDIVGVRLQDGTVSADNVFENPPAGLAPLFTLPSISTAENDFQRLSLYAYHHWEVIDGFMLIGGLAYDEVSYPANFRRPPLKTEEAKDSQVSPKAALLWDITPELRARAMYAQALGGMSYDESVRLEPTQLAGFSQSFRSLISESLVGSVEVPHYEIAGGALDFRPWENAWLSLQGEVLREKVDRETGLFNYDFSGLPPATPANTREELDYREFNARVIFNQIIGREWFFEAQYQFTRSELDRSLPNIAASANYARTTSSNADLHQFKLSATWQHPSGFFTRGEFLELIQKLGGSTAQPPGDDFPLLNLYAGYRFPHRRGELTLGVMNLLDEDYHLSPLNYHPEYPHERALFARFRFNF